MANIYEMMRQKAKDMGHAAAKLSDDAWQKYAGMRDRQGILNEAKLYVENYMMGNLDPAEFAQVMANDDMLRYTVSDLCRMRLDPVEPDIELGSGRIDIKAGVKTFWSEIRVPLPSEVDAARDIRNINFGIEAARAAAGTAEKGKDGGRVEPEKKPGFRERVSDARSRSAAQRDEKAIRRAEDRISREEEKIRSIREKQNGVSREHTMDASWPDTDRGRAYHDRYTEAAARHVWDMASGIEQKKAADVQDIHEITPAGGIGKTVIPSSGYSTEELDRPVDKDMKELFDQIMEHVKRDRAAEKGPGGKPGQDGQKEKKGWHRKTGNSAAEAGNDMCGKPAHPVQEKGPDSKGPDNVHENREAGDVPMHDPANEYEQLARDMEEYLSDDGPSFPACGNECELSAADCDALFEDQGMQM